MIKQAIPNDHIELSKLTKISKAYWGYSAEQILEWDEALTITPAYIKTNQVFKLCIDETIIGYYSYVEKSMKAVHLDNLFVLPSYIGKGFGQLLMLDFLERVKREDCTSITLDSEPQAERFYAKFGFEVIGQLPTSIEGRYLPIMQKYLINN